jgi:hypothetical protein
MRQGLVVTILTSVLAAASVANAQTPPPAPGTPSLISPADAAAVTQPVALDWSDASNAASDEIQVDDSSGFSAPLVNSLTSTASQTSVSGLAAGQYWWRVRAKNSAGVRQLVGLAPLHGEQRIAGGAGDRAERCAGDHFTRSNVHRHGNRHQHRWSGGKRPVGRGELHAEQRASAAEPAGIDAIGGVGSGGRKPERGVAAARRSRRHRQLDDDTP